MKRPSVLFFDVNETILDLAPMRESIGNALGNRPELVTLWFRTLLHYSLVVSAGGQYRPFGEIAVAVLTMLAKNNGLDLSIEDAQKAIKPILSLPPHPDVSPALEKIQSLGYRTFTLTNSSTDALEAQVSNADLKKYFEGLLSIDTIGLYKPNTRVYHWAAQQVGVQPENCMLIAAHGWDVAGAMWAGLRSIFIDRPGQAQYPLAPATEYVARDFHGLVEYLEGLD